MSPSGTTPTAGPGLTPCGQCLPLPPAPRSPEGRTEGASPQRPSLGAGSGFGSGADRGSPSHLPRHLGAATHFLQGLPAPRIREHQPSQASLRNTDGPSHRELPFPGWRTALGSHLPQVSELRHPHGTSSFSQGAPRLCSPPAPRAGSGPSPMLLAPLSSSIPSSLAPAAAGDRGVSTPGGQG